MIFKNYEYFLMIVEEESVSKAAERLHISQPSLSKYLKRLEENIGAELFSRDSHPICLTKAGMLYLSYVKEIEQKEKSLMQAFADLQFLDMGMVSIGLTYWRSSIVLPLVLPQFKKQYPRIEIKIYEGSHQYMASLLKREKADFSIFHTPHNYQNITFEHVKYEKILFCVSTVHPLLHGMKKEDHGMVGRMENEEFKQFHAEPFILLTPGQNIRDITHNFLSKLGMKPDVVIETSSIVTATNMVRAGYGVTFVPEEILRNSEQVQGLAFFTVDTPPLQWEVGFAYKTGTLPGNKARLLMECIRSSMNEAHVEE